MKKILICGFIFLCTLGILTYYILQMPSFGGQIAGARRERMQRSPEFKNGRFENDPVQHTDTSIIKNIQLYMQGQVRVPEFEVPVVKMDPENLKAPPPAGLFAYWLGHASVLVEIDGIRVMTDPVLSDFASPLPIGPKRLHPSPIPLEALSHIDAVVISHDHYDHLDMKTVQHLGQQGTIFFVGLGIGAHLERWGIPTEQIHEMEWWESAEIKGLRIHCTPARHYSGRKSMDNSTLWASWVLQGPQHSVYFSGDTGYAPHFRAIAQKFPGLDLALIKIGAYGETWLDIHMSPESAVQAHKDLGAKLMLPVHWATFNLSYHAWEEPILRTLAAGESAHVQVITPMPGERYEFGKLYVNTAWYTKK